jgi:hypothetical protein
MTYLQGECSRRRANSVRPFNVGQVLVLNDPCPVHGKAQQPRGLGDAPGVGNTKPTISDLDHNVHRAPRHSHREHYTIPMTQNWIGIVIAGTLNLIV